MMIYRTICIVDDICGVYIYQGTSYIKAMDAAVKVLNNDDRKDCWNRYQNGYTLREWRDIGSHIRKIYVVKEWL